MSTFNITRITILFFLPSWKKEINFFINIFYCLQIDFCTKFPFGNHVYGFTRHKYLSSEVKGISDEQYK